MTLLELLSVPLKRRRLIVVLTAAAALAAFCVTLFMPDLYTGTARLLPPQEPAGGLRSNIALSGGMTSILSGWNSGTTADMYVGILNSRSVADEIVEGFDLASLYGTQSPSKLYRILKERTQIEVAGKAQIIGISVQDRDPKRAAAMANAYAAALDRINRNVNVTEGQRKRQFLEKRLSLAAVDLQRAEEALKKFQQQYKIVDVDGQARAAVERASRIKAEIISAETELQVMKQFRTERQAEAKLLMAKVDELKKQLEKIETGSPAPLRKAEGSPDGDRHDSFPTFEELPDLSMQLGQLVREAKVQENVFELLTSQYEVAKIEEAKDLNTVQVLDKAIAPDRKSSPRHLLITGLAGGAGFFLALVLTYFLEYLETMKSRNPLQYRAFVEVLR